MVNSHEWKIRWRLASLGLGCFALLLTLEIVTESDELAFFDVAMDAVSLALTIAAAVGVTLLAQRMQAQHEEKMTLIRDLAIAQAEGNGWRSKVRSHLAGLKAGMDRQFQDWGMTPAEREVGLLILKGLSHKEIAALRATAEATVRQQAQSIYRKANLPGKTAFSAYFLEDLFAPDEEADESALRPSVEGPELPSRPAPPARKVTPEPMSGNH